MRTVATGWPAKSSGRGGRVGLGGRSGGAGGSGAEPGEAGAQGLAAAGGEHVTVADDDAIEVGGEDPIDGGARGRAVLDERAADLGRAKAIEAAVEAHEHAREPRRRRAH